MSRKAFILAIIAWSALMIVLMVALHQVASNSYLFGN